MELIPGIQGGIYKSIDVIQYINNGEKLYGHLN